MSVCVCDIGGTNFRMAVYDAGKLFDIRKIKTPNFFNYNEMEIKELIVKHIVDEYNAYKAKYESLDKLAVCFPGPVSGEGEPLGSSVIFGTDLHERFFLKVNLEEKLPDVKVCVVNDITAATYRYMGNGNFCLITVSSGIGNKVCIDNKVIIDKRGRSGEMGHFSYNWIDYDVDCTCGAGKNHVGMISSGRGVELFSHLLSSNKDYEGIFNSSELGKNVSFQSEKITAEMLAIYADKGDNYAKAVIDYCTVPLSMEICLLAGTLDLPKFIIIGGFATNCQYYLESLKHNAKKRGIYNFSEEDIDNMIVLGKRDDDHGLIGAGKMMEYI